MFTPTMQIDPNWVIAVLLGIVGFLLVRILNRIEKRIEVHDKQIDAQDKRLVVVETKLDISTSQES